MTIICDKNTIVLKQSQLLSRMSNFYALLKYKHFTENLIVTQESNKTLFFYRNEVASGEM